ncbi:MAG: hypothetical protein IJ480_06870 [Clostridia bacterium]|nr:hypothetical protein [Clostridia bacterium]
MKTILAVDAGGTKTRCVLLDENSRILAEAVTGCGNLALDYREAQANITEVLKRCLPAEKPEGVVVGAAGVSAAGAAEALTAALQAAFALPVSVVSDGCLALYGALEDRDGILVVSGTGSIIQGKKNGVLERCGGWGHLLGEYGSGAGIGYRLLTVLVQCIDTGTPVPKLTEAVYDSLGVRDRGELVTYVYSHPKADIAGLAAAADTLAEAGDGYAKSVLITEAHALAGWTAHLYRRMGFAAEEIRTSGGCIGNLPYFREQYRERLQELLPDAALCMDPFDPAQGAWHYYRQMRP